MRAVGCFRGHTATKRSVPGLVLQNWFLRSQRRGNGLEPYRNIDRPGEEISLMNIESDVQAIATEAGGNGSAKLWLTVHPRDSDGSMLLPTWSLLVDGPDGNQYYAAGQVSIEAAIAAVMEQINGETT
jgi:hypothetical protein